MPIRIRPLRLSDYAAIVHVIDLCGLHARTRGRDSRRAIAAQLRSRQNVYLGAFDRDRLVGTVFGTHDTRKGWINRLAVLPEYRRRGVGEKLVRAAERGLRSRGMLMFAALIESTNTPSRRLFTKLGYTTDDILYYRRKVREEV